MSADQPDDYKDTFVLYRHITGHWLVKVKDRLRLSEVSVWKLVNTITPKVILDEFHDIDSDECKNDTDHLQLLRAMLYYQCYITVLK